jgi:hypothetical protein
MLYLGRVFDMAWADSLLGFGIGPGMILAALLLTGIAAAMGLRGEIIKDS